MTRVMHRAHPEVQRAIGVGSWGIGMPLPGSDVDICLVAADDMAEVPTGERVARHAARPSK